MFRERIHVRRWREKQLGNENVLVYALLQMGQQVEVLYFWYKVIINLMIYYLWLTSRKSPEHLQRHKDMLIFLSYTHTLAHTLCPPPPPLPPTHTHYKFMHIGDGLVEWEERKQQISM